MKFTFKVSNVEVKSNEIAGALFSALGAEPSTNEKEIFKIGEIEVSSEYTPEEVAAVWDGAAGALDLLGDVIIEKIDKVTDPRRLGQYIQGVERMNAAENRMDLENVKHLDRVNKLKGAIRSKQAKANREVRREVMRGSIQEKREARMTKQQERTDFAEVKGFVK